jgi:hypothetical protein
MRVWFALYQMVHGACCRHCPAGVTLAMMNAAANSLDTMRVRTFPLVFAQLSAGMCACHPPPHLRRDCGLGAATSAPGPGSAPCHICTGTGWRRQKRRQQPRPSLHCATHWWLQRPLDMCCRILSFACTTVQRIHTSVQRSTARHVLAVGRRSISIRQQWGIRYSRRGTAAVHTCRRVLRRARHPARALGALVLGRRNRADRALRADQVDTAQTLLAR